MDSNAKLRLNIQQMMEQGAAQTAKNENLAKELAEQKNLLRKLQKLNKELNEMQLRLVG